MTDPTVLDVLYGVRDLLASPDRYCTGTFARDVEGYETHPLARDAASWCVLGAVDRTVGVLFGSIPGVMPEQSALDVWGETMHLLNAVVHKLGLGDSIDVINDTLDHKAVMRVVNVAINRELFERSQREAVAS